MPLSTKEMLYREPLEPENLTPEEAFQEGKQGDTTNYDAAARKAGRTWFEAGMENDAVAKVLGKILRLSKSRDRWQEHHGLSDDAAHQVWQDHFLDLMDYLSFVMKTQEPERKREIDSTGLSMFQAGWAVQAAADALKEESRVNDYGEPQST